MIERFDKRFVTADGIEMAIRHFEDAHQEVDEDLCCIHDLDTLAIRIRIRHGGGRLPSFSSHLEVRDRATG